MIQKLISFLQWKFGLTPEARCRRALRRAGLGPGDLAVDCGANVGEMTAVLAENGAEVHAFEPNPHAFKVLTQKFARQSNVFCHHAAAGSAPGRQPLYLHENSGMDEVLWSNGSSLLPEKPNVDRERQVEVEVIDLAAFLRSLPGPVKVLKMDVEGFEVELINHLLDTRAADLVECAFVETHENKIPELALATEALRKRLAREGKNNFHLDWV